MINSGDRTCPSKYRLAILAPHVVQYHSPLYREIAKSGLIAPTVFFLDRLGLDPVYEKEMNATVKWDIPLLEGFCYKFLKNYSPFKSSLFTGRVNPALAPELTRSRFQGVWIPGYNMLSYWVGLTVSKLRGMHVIFRGEAALSPESSNGKETFKGAVVRAVIGLSDAVLYTCRGNRKFLERYGCAEEKMFPVPCAVDNRFFRKKRQELRTAGADLRRQVGFKAHTVVLLCVGRIDSRKRQTDLAQAAALLQRQGIDVALAYVGDGPGRTDLENKCLNLGLQNVHFAGFQGQSRLPAYYEMADILCLCSSYDPSPKVVNEALNFELPIVSTSAPGTVGDVIVHDYNALVYHFGDTKTLAEHLRLLSSDPALRRRMGKRSMQLADKHSIEADVAGLETAIEYLTRKDQNGSS